MGVLLINKETIRNLPFGSVKIKVNLRWTELRMRMAAPYYLKYDLKTRHVHTTNAGFRLACRSPLSRNAAWSSLAVSELQLSAATPLWLYHRAASLPSWIEFNCLQSAVARLLINWQDAACCLVIPLWQVTLAQLN